MERFIYGISYEEVFGPDIEPADDPQTNPWIFIRYAEILLNYAEASIELGKEDDARIAMNLVRERAGMPDIQESEYCTKSWVQLIKRNVIKIRRW